VYQLVTPEAPQTTVGQLTPLREGGRTRDHKEISSGSKNSSGLIRLQGSTSGGS
jgi:hypothetical protein